MKKIFYLIIFAFFIVSCASKKNEGKFEKIIFHTSKCFGTCPEYHLELNQKKEIKLYVEKAYQKRKIDTVIVNDGKIPKEFILKYHREEEKDPVVIDKDEINKLNVNVIKDDFIKLRDKGLKHNSIKLSLRIFEELIK